MQKASLINQTLRLSDGRQLGYAEYGDPDGFPVLYCHGFPASRLEGRLTEATANRNRIRIIAADRPGYGLSDYQGLRNLSDWPNDIEQLLVRLDIQQAALLGVSGGGPFALAVLAKLPQYIRAASLVCPLGQVCLARLLKAMRAPARFGFSSARHAPWLMHFVYGGLIGPLMRFYPVGTLALLRVGMPSADRLILAQPDIKEVICASITEALSNGTRAALRDFLIYANPWDFDLTQIRQQITIWHGSADETVPIAHSHALIESLPNATLNILQSEGHFSLPIKHSNRILSELLGRCPS